jgi:hypothetical protein
MGNYGVDWSNKMLPIQVGSNAFVSAAYIDVYPGPQSPDLQLRRLVITPKTRVGGIGCFNREISSNSLLLADYTSLILDSPAGNLDLKPQDGYGFNECRLFQTYRNLGVVEIRNGTDLKKVIDHSFDRK